jgi:SAM-dependent methyltransferase
VRGKLERGAAVADVGCGAGRALISLARHFPASSYVGYDVYPPALAKARATAEAAGVADRVRFVEGDVGQGLPETYDLVTAFDVVHDLPDPRAALSAVRSALRPGGAFLLLESNCSEKLEENRGPAATILYGTSLLFCTPTSIGAGGEGLGTMGLPEPKVRALLGEAGFASVTRLPVDNPFNVLYEARP